MLRFTRDTIGTNSPLKVQRVYRTTARSIFLGMDYLFVLMALSMGGLIIYALLFSTFSMSNPGLAKVTFSILALVVLCLGIMVPIVDSNHWKYAYHVEITTFPEEHELEISLHDRVLRIGNGDLSKIRSFSNNAKLQLGFAEYYLTNGEMFILSFRTEGISVIEEYFKGIPIEHFVRHIPLIGKQGTRDAYANEVVADEKPQHKWATFGLVFLVGVCLLVTTYGMYADAKWQDEMSTRSPIVCMKIQYAERGAGTVKYPDKIYAAYLGKTYHFEMGRKYFRSLRGVDTIAVYYDAASDRAFLPTSGKVKHYRGLYVLVGGGGLVLIAGSIWELAKTRRKKRYLQLT